MGACLAGVRLWGVRFGVRSHPSGPQGAWAPWGRPWGLCPWGSGLQASEEGLGPGSVSSALLEPAGVGVGCQQGWALRRGPRAGLRGAGLFEDWLRGQG